VTGLADRRIQEAHGREAETLVKWDQVRAILGTAYEIATGQRLAPADFEGGKAGAVRVLGKLGFTVQPL
jgi:hypothetical protein